MGFIKDQFTEGKIDFDTAVITTMQAVVADKLNRKTRKSVHMEM